MKTMNVVTLLLILAVLPARSKADFPGGNGPYLEKGTASGVLLASGDEKLLLFSNLPGGIGGGISWSTEAEFESNNFGEFFYAALLGLGTVNTKEVGAVTVRGFSDPYLSYEMEFTNTEPTPIDLLFFPIIEIEPLDELSLMTSRLSVEYIDPDGSGGINATAVHRAYPQTEALGGFLAQEISLSIDGAGTFEEMLDPTLPHVPTFPPAPFTKLNTIFRIQNLLPGDSIIVTGRTDMEVPEPSTITLTLLGVSILAVYLIPRRSRRVLGNLAA